MASRQAWILRLLLVGALALAVGFAGGVFVDRQFWQPPAASVVADDQPCGQVSTIFAPVNPGDVPVRLADCNEATPPCGSLPIKGGRRVHIHHLPMVCNGPFDDVIDFTLLGNTAGCHDAAEADDPAGRPCSLPLRPLNAAGQPDFSVPAFPANVWAPKEGEKVHVVCQMLGNNIKSQGSLADKTGNLGKVWNKISDTRLPGGYAVYNDKWSLDRGWRNIRCT